MADLDKNNKPEEIKESNNKKNVWNGTFHGAWYRDGDSAWNVI